MKSNPEINHFFSFTTSINKLLFFLVLLTPILFLGCDPDTIGEDDDLVLSDQTNIHVAFAGGGWRAHTGHSAWVMSLLQADTSCDLSNNLGNPECLSEAFANVKTISGNSGGSWFSSMLMYDTNFVNQITSSNAVSNWGSTDSTSVTQGWLGKQQNKFSQFDTTCGSDTSVAYLECILETYYNSYKKSSPVPDWSMAVEDLIYHGYDWKKYGNLGDKKQQPWAKDKTLLMAATWVTNAAVLNDYDDEIFYQVCQDPYIVYMDGDDGSYCTSNVIKGSKVTTPDVWPLTFTSLAPNDASLKAPSFIATSDTSFNLGYTSAYEAYGDTLLDTINSSNVSTANVPVMWAAAASSAATGYASSYRVAYPKLSSKCKKYGISLPAWDCVWHFRNLALGFKIPDGSENVEFVANTTMDNTDLKSAKNDRAMRVADGGAIDNSGIAQLISYLQLNKMGEDFNIVAFDDVDENDSSNKEKYPSSDISYLFDGVPGDEICFDGICLQLPKLKIMEYNPSSDTSFTKYTWPVSSSDPILANDTLYYYIYKVQTVENKDFNIKGGLTGTIHVFASDFKCAGTAPENENDFECYNKMLKSFNATLRNQPSSGNSTKNGLKMLYEAFGL